MHAALDFAAATAVAVWDAMLTFAPTPTGVATIGGLALLVAITELRARRARRP